MTTRSRGRKSAPAASVDPASPAPPEAKTAAVSFDVDGEAPGETREGEKFLVPRTADTLQAFIHPSHVGVVALLWLVQMCAWGYVYLVVGVPLWVNIVHFLVQRTLYNAGLGYLLNIQSTERRFTRWYIGVTQNKDSLWARVVIHLANSNLPPGTTSADFPPAFNAWVVFKGIVNYVLACDSSAYFYLTYRCFSWPDVFDGYVIAQYAAGAALFAFFWWAKVDAHRCIGTYCWYWGDFFYRKNVSLTFDGIFELFPHPMYTVGYAIYYANSLICRSYVLLLCSLAAHMSQLVFLVLVEEPHIKRTYGGEHPELDADRAKLLYDAQSGLFPSRSDLKSFFKFNVHNSGSWSLLMGVIYVLTTALLPESSSWAVAQVVVWRLVHYCGIGLILWQQSARQSWTRAFEKKGRGVQEAFDHWKRIYHLSSTLNVVAFVAMTARFIPRDWTTVLTVSYLARCAVAAVLVALSAWTSWSMYETVGDFGWFYGDFFIPQDQFQHTLCYTGIYRFLNNPDAMTGYAGLYGLAIIAQSWTVFALAAAAQMANMVFVNMVEVPHMRRLYDVKGELRKEGPLRKKIKSLIDKALPDMPHKVKDQNDRLQAELRKVRNKALIELYTAYRRIKSLRQDGGVAPSPVLGPSSPSAAVAFDSDVLSPASASVVDAPPARRTSSRKSAARAASPDGDSQLPLASSSAAASSSASTSAAGKAGKGSASAAAALSLQTTSSGRPSLIAARAAQVGVPLRIGFTTAADHADTDWIGIYPPGVPSVPGLSEGKWIYVPPGARGEVVMQPYQLPRAEGIYELRYHTRNTYDVQARRPIIFTLDDDSNELAAELDKQ